MKLSAVILCAGSGSRFGQNKMTLPMAEGTVATCAVSAFRRIAEVTEKVVVAPPQALDAYKAQFADCKVVAGGETRADSVRLALDAVTGEQVLVHDGARPNVSEALINRVIDALRTHSAVVPVVGATDSVMDASGYLAREQLKMVQTPQGFRTDLLRECFAAEGAAHYTDEGALVAVRCPVYTVAGEPENRKITHPIDYWGLVGQRKTGVGYDIHRLQAGRPLVLCGVRIPHESGLLGHSDADCALHALMDAALGACALPDIGHFFPNTPEWKDADSTVLLRIVLDNLAASHARIVQASVYIVAEAPRLAPYLEAMRAKLATLLAIPLEAVGVGVTTNERVPMRVKNMTTNEAIAAFATVTVAQL